MTNSAKHILLSAGILIVMVGVLSTGHLRDATHYSVRFIELANHHIHTLWESIVTIIEFESSDRITRPPHTDTRYDESVATIHMQRLDLAMAYTQAQTSQDRQAVLEQARETFTHAVITLLPYWYGTPWDYNGVTQIPQQGKIACGYYVSTVLQDSGLNVERSRLAQQASENIIKSLIQEPYIKRFSQRPMDEFLATIETWGKGIYIVGLDYHVGYLWHDGQQMRFIHSTSYPFNGVMSEPAGDAYALTSSKYRVVGKLTADDTVIIDWLNQARISTKT